MECLGGGGAADRCERQEGIAAASAERVFTVWALAKCPVNIVSPPDNPQILVLPPIDGETEGQSS